MVRVDTHRAKRHRRMARDTAESAADIVENDRCWIHRIRHQPGARFDRDLRQRCHGAPRAFRRHDRPWPLFGRKAHLEEARLRFYCSQSFANRM